MATLSLIPVGDVMAVYAPAPGISALRMPTDAATGVVAYAGAALLLWG